MNFELIFPSFVNIENSITNDDDRTVSNAIGCEIHHFSVFRNELGLSFRYMEEAAFAHESLRFD